MHATRIDIENKKSFPFMAKRGKYDQMTLRPVQDLHDTWSKITKQRLIYTTSDTVKGFCY